jgi:hypothetical protein
MSDEEMAPVVELEGKYKMGARSRRRELVKGGGGGMVKQSLDVRVDEMTALDKALGEKE